MCLDRKEGLLHHSAQAPYTPQQKVPVDVQRLTVPVATATLLSFKALRWLLLPTAGFGKILEEQQDPIIPLPFLPRPQLL